METRLLVVKRWYRSYPDGSPEKDIRGYRLYWQAADGSLAQATETLYARKRDAVETGQSLFNAKAKVWRAA